MFRILKQDIPFTDAAWIDNVFRFLVSLQITWPSACEESWPQCPRAFCAYSCALGDECAAPCTRNRQRGHDDVFGFSSEAEIEMHYPAKHSALKLKEATRTLSSPPLGADVQKKKSPFACARDFSDEKL